MSEYKPMGGRPDRMKLRCETTAGQSAGGKKGGARTLDANQIDAIWKEVQQKTRDTLRWIAPAK